MMEPHILVACATRFGSTAKLAQMMAEILRGRGGRPDLQPARELIDLYAYDSVVLVAALYMGRLHRDARRFLANHRQWLERLPVALLVAGPVEKSEKDWAGARAQLAKELAGVPWLHPVATHVVGGVFDPKQLSFPYTLIPALRKMPPKDARDWREIEKAAVKIAGKLEAALSVGA